MLSLFIVSLAAGLAFIGLGGGFYETSVVDPCWPCKPELIQPGRGGLSRKRFWIPAHTAFEVALIAALVATWSTAIVRNWLLVALASHIVMRLWSAFDFIPKALAFEQADPETISRDAARRWTRRSRLRLPLDLLTCVAVMAALVLAADRT